MLTCSPLATPRLRARMPERRALRFCRSHALRLVVRRHRLLCRYLQVWSLASGERLLTISFASLPLTALAVDEGETTIAVGTSAGAIHLVDLFDHVRAFSPFTLCQERQFCPQVLLVLLMVGLSVRLN